jgi:hypothetical protein
MDSIHVFDGNFDLCFVFDIDRERDALMEYWLNQPKRSISSRLIEAGLESGKNKFKYYGKDLINVDR